MEEEMRIGGQGANGCTCAIMACYLCPVHGDDEHLSYDGKRLRNEKNALLNKWDNWMKGEDPCFVCGAQIVPKQRRLHRTYHTGTDV